VLPKPQESDPIAKEVENKLIETKKSVLEENYDTHPEFVKRSEFLNQITPSDCLYNLHQVIIHQSSHQSSFRAGPLRDPSLKEGHYYNIVRKYLNDTAERNPKELEELKKVVEDPKDTKFWKISDQMVNDENWEDVVVCVYVMRVIYIR
jgi:hypothetical protein